jgi:hypothetical protein
MQCYECSYEGPDKDFLKKRHGKESGLCLECRRKWGRQHYKENRKAQINRVRANKDKYKEETQTYVRELKRQPCMDCGHKFHWYAMDFDHREGVEKEYNIYKMTQGSHTLEALKREIAKCDMVCAVCHRLRTAKRLGLQE